jgi:DNA-binding transcriptional LysR family regulator
MARAFDPVHLGSIEIFCKAAELGSFTAAAEWLGITPAAVSRSVARLEARLGVRLFVRSTRHLRLTAEGDLYKNECQQALEQISAVENAVTGQQQAPSGRLRISVGTVYAHHRLIPVLPQFTAAHPKIDIELNISNRNVDFIEDGYDLVIRRGHPQPSRLIARKLEDASMGVFAAPAYLRAHGEPQTLEDLETHRCIPFVLPSTGRALPWLFHDAQGRELDLPVHSPLRVNEDVLGCVGWARAGGGLAQSYHFVTEAAVRAGELVEVLQPFAGRRQPFYILYPQNRQMTARVRVFVDFLVEALAGQVR